MFNNKYLSMITIQIKLDALEFVNFSQILLKFSILKRPCRVHGYDCWLLYHLLCVQKGLVLSRNVCKVEKKSLGSDMTQRAWPQQRIPPKTNSWKMIVLYVSEPNWQ